MNEEVIKLILDLAGSSKDVSELIGKLGELKGKSNEVASTYQVLAGEMGTYEVAERKATDTTRQFNPALDAAVAKAVEATRAQALLRQSLEDVAEAQAKASGSSKEMSMRILNLGRAAQDLAQGGLGGVINNIEGIVGGGGLAAGVLTALGTAALLATPYIKEYWKSLTGGGEKVPQATDQIERYTEAINKNKKELQDLKEKQELTYEELLKYKQLVFDTTQLEEDQARARDARVVGPNSDKKSRERASAVKETIAERFESSQELIDKIMATEQGQQVGLKRIEELMAGAQKGNGLDIESLKNTSPAFRQAYEQFSPEAKQRQKLEEKLAKDEQAAQDKRGKAIAAKDKMVDTLNEQGREADQARKDDAKKEFRDFLKQGRSDRGISQGMQRENTQLQKRQSAQQTAREVRGIQVEASANGIDINAKQAFQILQQRRHMEAELQKTQAETMGAVLGSTEQLRSNLEMWKSIRGNATQQASRTNQTTASF